MTAPKKPLRIKSAVGKANTGHRHFRTLDNPDWWKRSGENWVFAQEDDREYYSYDYVIEKTPVGYGLKFRQWDMKEGQYHPIECGAPCPDAHAAFAALCIYWDHRQALNLIEDLPKKLAKYWHRLTVKPEIERMP